MSRVYPLVQKEQEGPINWVFIHGWGSDNRLWDNLREHLTGSHFAIDLPGFGEAEEYLPSSLDDYLVDIEVSLPRNCILVGWSLGGMIATQLAARSDGKSSHSIGRVVGLITFASNPCFVVREGWPAAMSRKTFVQFQQSFEIQPNKVWARFCGLQVQGAENPKLLLEKLKQQKPPKPVSMSAWMQGLCWLNEMDNRQALHELVVPHFHILGVGDALVPESAASAIAELGQAEVRLIGASGHCPHLTQTNEVAIYLQSWIAKMGFQKAVSRVCPQQINKLKIARSFGSAAKTYDAAAQVQAEIAQDLLSFGLSFGVGLNSRNSVLDLGCGTGFVAHLLQQRAIQQEDLFPRSLSLLDLAEPMVSVARNKLDHKLPNHYLVADAEALPIKSECFEIVLSSLAIQWCSDLTVLGREVTRTLVPGGYFLFATLGEHTLLELKSAWKKVNSYVHVNDFKPISDVQSEIEASGLIVDQIKSYTTIVKYQSVLPILRDLKAIGAHNMNSGQNQGLTPARQLRELESAYEEFRCKLGLLPVTYDVILILAKKPKTLTGEL